MQQRQCNICGQGFGVAGNEKGEVVAIIQKDLKTGKDIFTFREKKELEKFRKRNKKSVIIKLDESSLKNN